MSSHTISRARTGHAPRSCGAGIGAITIEARPRIGCTWSISHLNSFCDVEMRGSSPAGARVFAVSGSADRGYAVRLSGRPARSVCVPRGRPDVSSGRGVERRKRPFRTWPAAGSAPNNALTITFSIRASRSGQDLARRLGEPGGHESFADGRLGRAGQRDRVQPLGRLALIARIDLRDAGRHVGRPRLGLRGPQRGHVSQPHRQIDSDREPERRTSVRWQMVPDAA